MRNDRPEVAASPYMAQLDGLRAIAVMAVFVEHWVSPAHHYQVPWGALGVQLFFVISGFLITGILLDCRELVDGAKESGLGVIRRFYARRALRILPAYYAVIALTYFAGIPEVRDSYRWHLGYLSNVFFFLRGDWHGSVSHFWSLAVEEQFYLVWPWLILFFPRRALWPLLLLCASAAPLFRAGTLSSQAPVSFDVLPATSLDTLGIGSLFALLTRSAGGGLVSAEKAAGVCLRLGLPGYITLRTFQAFVPYGGAVVFEQSFLAMFYAWVVFRASKGFAGPAGRALEFGPLRALGKISYGLYLWHNFVPLLLRKADPLLASWAQSSHAVLRLGLLFTITIAIATVSWFVLERPVNRLKHSFPYGERRETPRSDLRTGAEGQIESRT